MANLLMLISIKKINLAKNLIPNLILLLTNNSFTNVCQRNNFLYQIVLVVKEPKQWVKSLFCERKFVIFMHLCFHERSLWNIHRKIVWKSKEYLVNLLRCIRIKIMLRSESFFNLRTITVLNIISALRGNFGDAS